jgi:hypothetical protein
LGVLARIEVRQMRESLAVGSHSIYLAPPTSSHPLSYTPPLSIHTYHPTPHSRYCSSSSIFAKSSITPGIFDISCWSSLLVVPAPCRRHRRYRRRPIRQPSSPRQGTLRTGIARQFMTMVDAAVSLKLAAVLVWLVVPAQILLGIFMLCLPWIAG